MKIKNLFFFFVLSVLTAGFYLSESNSVNVTNKEGLNEDLMEIHVGVHGTVKRQIEIGGGNYKWVGVSGASVTVTSNSGHVENVTTNSSGYYYTCVDDFPSGSPDLPWTVHVSCAYGSQTKTVSSSGEFSGGYYWCGLVTAARKDFNLYPPAEAE
ncbi:MAG: hypothetical protein PVH88_03930 [Ignavibacteria bacterium]|jgi:hypothetical protein